MSEEATKNDETNVLIIGCGIAGPVLAMFLDRAGFKPEIYEAATAPRDDEGAFLELAPMGVNILHTLGITSQDLETVGGFPDTGIKFYNGDGKQIGALDGTDEIDRYGARSYIIKRGRLAGLLRDHATNRGIEVEFGKKLVNITKPISDPVEAVFGDGSRAQGEFLVGCDGTHSQTRQLILPNAPGPEFTGMIDCGGFTERPESIPSSDEMHMTFGKRAFFGYLAKPDDEVYWFDNIPWSAEPQRGELDRISNSEWKDHLLNLHTADHQVISDIIRSTSGDTGRWPLYDLPNLEQWYNGSVCLIGDAAHATPPHNGHGASMAMEDAIVLAKCVRDIPDTARAFEMYQHKRKQRVGRVAEQARRIGKQKAVSNPIKLWFRDRLMPVFLRFGTNSMDWLFAYSVDWNQKITYSKQNL